MKKLLLGLGVALLSANSLANQYAHSLPKQFYGCWEYKDQFDIYLSNKGWEHYASREGSSGDFTLVKLINKNKAVAVDDLGYEYSFELKNNNKTLVYKMNSKMFNIKESYTAKKVKCPF